MQNPGTLRKAELDRWILAQRPARAALDAERPYAFFVEEECGPSGAIEQTATILLTNRECPWRCVMCDLWRNTLTQSTPQGAIPKQIEYALLRMPPARTVKLYNSGSFFDSRAIPVPDHAETARLLRGFQRVIVESHPALVGPECARFRDRLGGCLEVAMGLETAHPRVLQRLNKGITLQRFRKAAAYLQQQEIALRVFLLVQPPFMQPEATRRWTERSLHAAFDCGATAVSLILTRGGNGAMESLAASGEFVPPTLQALERALAYGLALRKGRVFADLWELPRARECTQCFDARVSRLRAMNLEQRWEDPVRCAHCEGS